jgi:EEF1A lysine methyltransferase 4
MWGKMCAALRTPRQHDKPRVMEKEVFGEFEWIAEFEYLQEYFKFEYTDIGNYSTKDALVVGCGTSTLSESLLTLGLRSVVSVDNDEDCIKYMENKYIHCSNLSWVVYDLIEFSHMNQTFDLVVDKGSLDAMLVEGSIATLLCEIFRLLNPGGVYFLCSLHSPVLLLDLLASDPLRYLVSFHGDCSQPDGQCKTIAICKKTSSSFFIDPQAMAATESQAMDLFYQIKTPLLTAEKIRKIDDFFALHGNNPLPLKDIHSFIFERDEVDRELGYTLDLFLEDLSGECPGSVESGVLSLQDTLNFIKSMQ